MRKIISQILGNIVVKYTIVLQLMKYGELFLYIYTTVHQKPALYKTHDILPTTHICSKCGI